MSTEDMKNRKIIMIMIMRNKLYISVLDGIKNYCLKIYVNTNPRKTNTACLKSGEDKDERISESFYRIF